MTTATAQRSEFVQEFDDRFLSLWPYRYDFIYAPHPHPGEKPNWQTESRYPVSDRLILQGSSLYGVRVGAQTSYAMLDIDAGSPYHPEHDPLALGRITGALERLGLVRHLIVTSSHSGGLHLYFPFPSPLPTWKIALAVTSLLENDGFKIAGGLLEVFPNVKGYSFDDSISLYNGHRLPLQEPGSYLLNTDLQPTFSSGSTFVEQWQHCTDGNDINGKLLARIIKQARRKRYGRISVSAQKFLNDLNAEIELGWTGSGQTNRLLGRITLRSYIFGHVMNGGEPMEGQALIDEIISTARSLPGFYDYCRHQHELEDRAKAWAKCVENSHYYHFGKEDGKFKPKKDQPNLGDHSVDKLTWNEQRSESTREKIRQAIAELLETDQLPPTATERFRLLTHYGIGGGSLYRHRDLWHPEHLWKAPPDPPNASTSGQWDCSEGAPHCHTSTSLLSLIDGNPPDDKHFSDSDSPDSDNMVGNPLPDKVSNDLSSSDAPSGVEYVQHVLFDIKDHREADKQAAKAASIEVQQAKEEAAWQAHQEQMQQYLASDDPILVAEAQTWPEQHPELLGRKEETPNRTQTMSAIASLLKRLAWSPSKVRGSLLNLFGKSSVAELNDKALVWWRRWLTTQSGTDEVDSG